jgi:hypothetical protein
MVTASEKEAGNQLQTLRPNVREWDRGLDQANRC